MRRCNPARDRHKSRTTQHVVAEALSRMQAIPPALMLHCQAVAMAADRVQPKPFAGRHPPRNERHPGTLLDHHWASDLSVFERRIV